MKTPQEVREAKTRIIQQGDLIFELTQHEGYKLLEEKIQIKLEEAKASALDSESYEELRYRRGYLEGLNAFNLEVTKIIAKAKKQKQLTSK